MDKEISDTSGTDRTASRDDKSIITQTGLIIKPDMGNKSESRTETNNVNKRQSNYGNSLQKNVEIIEIKKEPNDIKTQPIDLVLKLFTVISAKYGSDLDDENKQTISLYMSDDKKLFHASAKCKFGIDPSITSTTGTEFQITPVKDTHISELVFNYFKLIGEEPKGIITLCKDGKSITEKHHMVEKQSNVTTIETNNGQNVNGKKGMNMNNAPTAMTVGNDITETNQKTEQEIKVEIKEEPMEMDEQWDNVNSNRTVMVEQADNGESNKNEEVTGRILPPRNAKLVGARKIVDNLKTESKVIPEERETDSPEKSLDIKPPGPQKAKIAKQAALKRLYSSVPVPQYSVEKDDGQSHLFQIFEKYAKVPRKQKKLIVDKKTDIPIMEMKMNMQVTADTMCQTPQLAPCSKAKMESENNKDNIMNTPGKKIQSEKLLEIFNSRLYSSTVPDSDDELEDLGLQKDVVIVNRRRPGGSFKGEDNSEVKYEVTDEYEDSKGWKICYL